MEILEKLNMKVLHTPGPWATDYVMSESVLDVILGYHPPGAGNPTVIATVYPDDESDSNRAHFISQREANANARLIAAAPEILSELIDFHNHAIDLGNHDCAGIPGGCPVLAVIKKAMG